MPLTNDLIAPAQMAEKNARATRVNVRERSYSDETVTVDSAITVSGVIAIIILIAQDTASLPLILYGKQGRNKFRATDSPYYTLMHDQPNPEHSAMTFREFIVSHIIAWGDFFAQIVTDESGTAKQLWPLRPDKMVVKRFEGERIYLYTDSEGKQRVFLQEEILHIPGFGFDGLRGLSRIGLARHVIGENISTQKFGSKFFANNGVPGFIYKHPTELSETAYAHLLESLDEKTGVDNSHKPLILEDGLSIEKIGIPLDDAQFLETRKFQLSEINRIIGPVPPHMIGDVTSSTSWGTGIDSQEQGYVNHTLRPYAVRIEQGLRGQLLLESDRAQGYFYEHLFDGFLRGDIATRFAAYGVGINNGFMTRNEVRARENLNPRKGLDELLVPMNMTTLSGSNTADSTQPDGTDTQAMNAFEPLWRDAIGRVMKRETNDLLGASKRYQAKGQQAAYEKWVDEFYSVDHPAFIKKQFQPVLDAQMRLLYGIDISEQLNVFITEFLEDRIEQSKPMTFETLSESIDHYVATATEKFMQFVFNAFAVTVMDASEAMEIDYE